MRESPNDVETLLRAPEHQDEGVWKYEHLRQFCMDLNLITVKLQNECSPETCSQMTATEQWIFLCAAHKNPKEVSLLHTVNNRQTVHSLRLLSSSISSVAPLITQDIHLMAQLAYSTATDTFLVGKRN